MINMDAAECSETTSRPQILANFHHFGPNFEFPIAAFLREPVFGTFCNFNNHNGSNNNNGKKSVCPSEKIASLKLNEESNVSDFRDQDFVPTGSLESNQDVIIDSNSSNQQCSQHADKSISSVACNDCKCDGMSLSLDLKANETISRHDFKDLRLKNSKITSLHEPNLVHQSNLNSATSFDSENCKNILEGKFIRDSAATNCALLVGVGPGDPNLLTIAAYKAIREAEILITDQLVSEDILSLCSAGAEIKRPLKCKQKNLKLNSRKAQDEINEWIVEGLKTGKKVCRLKGGDPFLFGRGLEEVAFVLERGFTVKVVPGISSAFCAPLAAGISVTKRGNIANKVLVATAHGQFDSFPDVPEFKSDTTLVFLMGVSRLSSLVESLINNGFAVSTSVAIVEKATTKEQRVVRGTLENIVELANTNEIKSPATIVVGRAVSNDELPALHRSAYHNGGVVFYPN